jgi:hypothetical protein
MKHKILLVIDLQKEFSDSDEYNKVLSFVKSNGNLGNYDKIISTVFVNINSNYNTNLNWSDCKNANLDSLEYLDDIDSDIHSVVYKSGYGSTNVVNTIRDYIRGTDKDVEIDIVGCDLDACIMAICFQLWDANIENVKILTDYCFTSSKDFTKEDVLKLMKRNFGKYIEMEE